MDGRGAPQNVARAQRRPESFYADQALAERAVGMASPLIESAMRDKRHGDSGFLHVVVMNPGLGPADSRFEDAILYEHSFGDRSKWDADYQAFARAKTEVAWRHQRDSHAVQALQPHRLANGETTLWGSVWVDGIVVGASGAFAPFDEAYSGVVAMCLRALAKQRAEENAKALFLR
ncbi:MAG TPA: hypothetical protein VFP44_24060 [Usitatibacter sp.]|nr:hypothetical protein [Usitatibacter sp.]